MTITHRGRVIATRTDTKRLPDRYAITATAELVHLAGNARPYFSVTGELLNLRHRGDNQIEACGAMHDDIGRHFPHLAPVIIVHLADDDGTPMHATANAAHWMGLSRWGDGRPMSPGDEYGRRALETDADGLEWAPETLARHLRVPLPQAREWRAYVAGDPNTAEALRHMARTLAPMWSAQAGAALAVIREGE